VPRRTSILPVLAGILVLTLILALVLTAVSTLLPGFPSILGVRLSERTEPTTLAYFTVPLTCGAVLEVGVGAFGVTLTGRDERHEESLKLEGVGLDANDVVVPHLFDWFLNASSTESGITFNYADSTKFTVMTALKDLVAAFPEIGRLVVRIGVAPANPSGTLRITRESSGTRWQLYAKTTSATYTLYMDNVSVNKWLHFKLVRDGSVPEFRVYVNDTLYGPLSGSYTPSANIITLTSWYGLIGYFAFLSAVVTEAPGTAVIQSGPALSIFLDPTAFNGTHYVDLSGNGYHGTPFGNVVRRPAENRWLWLVKGVAKDSRVHLRFAPAGSVFRVRYGDTVYEWRVPLTCANSVGLCEDFPIDISVVTGTAQLQPATVELVYTSSVRIRVPDGFWVSVEGSGYRQATYARGGYVDAYIPGDGEYTVRVLGYRRAARVRVDEVDGKLRVLVTDASGYALGGAKVFVFSGRNVVTEGTANDLGFYEFDKSLVSTDQVRVVVHHMKGGAYYYADEVVSLTATATATQPVIQAQQLPTTSATAAALLLLLLGIVTAVVALVGRRRR